MSTERSETMTQQNSTKSYNGMHGNGKRNQWKKTVTAKARMTRRIQQAIALRKKEIWKER